MAAPGYLYKGKLTAQGVSDSKIIMMTASSGADKELMKARFYLDFFIAGSELGVEGLQGEWAGACYVGSPNYYMHNLARHGWAEITHDGRKAVVYWDAGLNTLSTVTNSYVESDKLSFFIVKTTGVSAFWVGSDVVGARYAREDKQGNIGAWDYSSVNQYIPEKESSVVEFSLPDVNSSFFEFGDIVHIQFFIDNVEGRYYSPNIISSKVNLIEIELGLGTPNNFPTTYYTNSVGIIFADPNDTGAPIPETGMITRIWRKNESGNLIPVNGGIYYPSTSDEYWYLVGGEDMGLPANNYVIRTQYKGSGGGGDPTIEDTRDYVAVNSVQNTACRNASIRPEASKTFKSISTGLWYNDVELTVLANGYYIEEQFKGIDYYNNGVLTSGIGYCQI